MPPAKGSRKSESHKANLAIAQAKKWEDPDWARSQSRAIGKGHLARSERLGTKPKLRKGKLKVQVSVYLDPLVYADLRRLAKKQGEAITELIRTYIQWGLDVEEENSHNDL